MAPAGVSALADQQLLRSLIETLPGTVYRARNDGLPDRLGPWRLVYISGQCRALTGLEPEALLGDGDSMYARLIHPEDRPTVERGLLDAIGHGKPFQLTYRIRHVDGERWVWEQGQGIYDARGSVLGVQGFLADVSDRRHHERVRSDEARLAGVRLTARTFEHELRNLLAITAGYTEVLARDDSLSERGRKRAERAHRCLMEAVAVIRNLTDAVALEETNWGIHGTTLQVRDPAA